MRTSLNFPQDMCSDFWGFPYIAFNFVLSFDIYYFFPLGYDQSYTYLLAQCYASAARTISLYIIYYRWQFMLTVADLRKRGRLSIEATRPWLGEPGGGGANKIYMFLVAV